MSDYRGLLEEMESKKVIFYGGPASLTTAIVRGGYVRYPVRDHDHAPGVGSIAEPAEETFSTFEYKVHACSYHSHNGKWVRFWVAAPSDFDVDSLSHVTIEQLHALASMPAPPPRNDMLVASDLIEEYGMRSVAAYLRQAAKVK